MVKLTGLISQIGCSKVMVIGDFLLDAYTFGKARRISPEAPVAIVQVIKEESRPGGAGNVALNLISLGTEVVVVGRIGKDSAGELLCKELSDEGINIQGMVVQHGFPTPVKNRIIAENQQIVRIDHEVISPIPELLEQRVIDSLPALMEGVNVVAISDYGKGFLSKTLLIAIVDIARQKGIQIVTDPKGIDFAKYRGTTLLKPNLSEAYAAANLPFDAPLELVAERVLQLAQAEVLMITRSEAGISLFHQNGVREDFPVRVREVKDVTGAGDTVLAMVTCALANQLPLAAAVQLSNVAAGIAIEHLGCARVSLSELARRLLEEDVGNKVFDQEHLFALQHALKGKAFSLLVLSEAQELTSAIFSAIDQLSRNKDKDLLVYIKDPAPNEEFIRILSSLHGVNFIILKGENLHQLCSVIQPDEVFLVDKNRTKKLSSSINFEELKAATFLFKECQNGSQRNK